MTDNNLVFTNGLYHSFNHHGSFSNTNKEELVNKINHTTRQAHNALKHADVLLITFGTSNVFVNNDNSEVVANCHKFPQSKFSKEQLQPGEIINRYSQLIEDLKVFNPKLKIIFTVSPVKYLKDGLIENNLSKAVLTYSVHEIIKEYNYCSYFPAYELVTDDLRDYVDEGLAVGPDRVAHMVSRYLPDVPIAPSRPVLPPRPDQSLWAPAGAAPVPRWMPVDSVVDTREPAAGNPLT